MIDCPKYQSSAMPIVIETFVSVFPWENGPARHPWTVIYAIVTCINGIVIMRVNGLRLMSSETKAGGQKCDVKAF